MNAFWSSCLQQLEQELPPQQFNTWIKALRMEDGDGGVVRIMGEVAAGLAGDLLVGPFHQAVAAPVMKRQRRK